MPSKYGATQEEMTAYLYCKGCRDYVDQVRVSRWKAATDKYKCEKGHRNVVISMSDFRIEVTRRKKS